MAGLGGDSVPAAQARLLTDQSTQFHWPAEAAPPPPHPVDLPHVPFDPKLLFWIIIVVALVGAATLLIPRLRLATWRRAGPTPVLAKGPPPMVVVPRAGLDRADALAAAGDYAAAVHSLLLTGIDAIDRRFPRALSPASTSRDIAALPVLPPGMRDAFSGIAATAERAVFAGRALLQEDWAVCRARYAAVAEGRR